MTAYEPDPAAGLWTEKYRVMPFPQEWRAEFLELYRRRWRGAEHLPVSSLNDLFRATAPGLVATGRGAGSSSEMPWVYASEELPSELVPPLLASWVMTLPPGDELNPKRMADHQAALDRALAMIDQHSPQWRQESVDLTAAGVSPGGTAQPDRRLYPLLPERIGALLADRPLLLNGDELSFRVITCDQGVELVSWPPRAYGSKGRTWYYSALVTVTMQTVPFHARFRVHASYGIRRWATQSPVKLEDGRGATVLLDAPSPWLGTGSPRRRLTANSVGYDRRLGMLTWRGQSLVNLLPEMDVVRVYPKPSELTAEPAVWLGGRDGVAAGILYSSTTMGSHGVGGGLMPLERSLLDRWVEEALHPMFRRVPDLERAYRWSKPAVIPKAQVKDPEDKTLPSQKLVRVRRDALRAALAEQPLVVEVLWQTEETKEELITALRKWLGLSSATPDENGKYAWQDDDLHVMLLAQPLGTLGTPLEIAKEAGHSRAQRLADAVRKRAEQVASRLGPCQVPVGLTIVETRGRKYFTSFAADSDCKNALRLGCAQAARVSQFIVVPEDSEGPLAERAASAVADGMRQLGAFVPPEQRLGEEIADDLQFLAIWQVRRLASGPTRRSGEHLVALRIRPRDSCHPVRGWDGRRKEWVPYSELLLTLAAAARMGDIKAYSTDAERRDHIERQIRSLLFQVRDRPTLVMVNSGNLRDAWPGLANGQLRKDMITFCGEEPTRLALHGADLRLVLLRDANSREETAECYAPGGTEDATPGFSSGLWVSQNAEPDNRVFFSTTDKPATSKQRRDVQKLVPDPNWPHGPAATAWNPQALEITVLGCLSEAALAEDKRISTNSDKPTTIAAITHQLRFHDEYEPLSRPLPSHLAKLAEEYVLPLAGAHNVK
ncbi:hypothetical protein GCM10022252_78520 [Streptosporangium oxazolinicum]|uniref:DUF3893 domain-containing protein n=1 Tax=Streptosporangium oxazolinicum TaxID=909287 RepID=A0ABP8BMV3_9ACTN